MQFFLQGQMTHLSVLTVKVKDNDGICPVIQIKLSSSLAYKFPENQASDYSVILQQANQGENPCLPSLREHNY